MYVLISIPFFLLVLFCRCVCCKVCSCRKRVLQYSVNYELGLLHQNSCKSLFFFSSSIMNAQSHIEEQIYLNVRQDSHSASFKLMSFIKQIYQYQLKNCQTKYSKVNRSCKGRKIIHITKGVLLYQYFYHVLMEMLAQKNKYQNFLPFSNKAFNFQVQIGSKV